ncbi:hypothetical protein HYX13_02190 [Candidatus Woesearchaeota archaeon]|nr:hypothetical protein [Candidatus Woesearchaeota archaeon]
MATTFLLDSCVLDDTVLENMPAVEIVAEGFAYFKDGEHGHPSYTFYQSNKNGYDSGSLRSLEVFQSEYDGHHGDLSLRFQKANVIFMPISDGEKHQWGSSISSSREDYLNACSVLYVCGEFKKADVDILKKYGVSIKP